MDKKAASGDMSSNSSGNIHHQHQGHEQPTRASRPQGVHAVARASRENAAEGEGEGTAGVAAAAPSQKRPARSTFRAPPGRLPESGPEEAAAETVANENAGAQEEERSPLLSSLLEHLVELAHQAGFAEELIEVSKARLLLEATAGQVPLAAQLYWDDVLARTHNQQQRPHPGSRGSSRPNPPPPPPPPMAFGVAAPAAAAVAPPPPVEQAPPVRQRSLRRRLETDYEHLQQKQSKHAPRAHGNNSLHNNGELANNDNNNHNPAPPAEEAHPPVYYRRRRDPPAWMAPGLSNEERRQLMLAPQQPVRRVRTVPTRQAAVAAAQAIAEQERIFHQRYHRPRSEEEIRDFEQACRQEEAARDGLENHFNDPEDDDDDEEDEDEDDIRHGHANRHGDVLARGAAEEQNDNPIEEEDEDEDGPRPRLMVARRMETSVSVSDDEAAAEILRTVDGVQRRVRRKPLKGRKRPSSSFDDDLSLQRKRSRTLELGVNDDGKNMEENGYLSDNDWIWESLSSNSRNVITPVAPMDFLWGISAEPVARGSANDDDQEDGTKKSDSKDNSAGISNDSAGSNSGEIQMGDVVVVDVNECSGAREVSARTQSGGDKSGNDSKDKSEHGRKTDENEPMEESSTGDGDGHDENEINDEDDEMDEEEKGATIPVTWLRAGIGFADDLFKRGLSCNAPNEDDIAYLQWKQQLPASSSLANSRRRGGRKQRITRPPYHCPSVTLLPAIVTALMHAGVTVVKETNATAPRVTCQTTQKAYHLLDEKTRRREWEQRLVDALTALLVIAAQASKQRKTKALERAQRMEECQRQQEQQKRQEATPDENRTENVSSLPAEKKKDSPVAVALEKTRHAISINDDRVATTSPCGASARWQKLHSKLQLCPTCWWQRIDPNSANFQAPTSNHGHILPTADEPFTIPISYTHICDLRSYVKSNLDAFMGTGGCALFLETILRIHGKGAVQRMVHLARDKEFDNCKSDKKNAEENCPTKIPPLLRCNCLERYQRTQQKQRISSWPGASKTAYEQAHEESEDPCNDCASIELISLLLTGRVYSSWKGWSTSMAPYARLGIGVLTDRPGEVGRGLTRPEKPVWIVKGPSQYSVLFLNERNSSGVLDESKSFVVNMTHWSCWYDDQGEDNDDQEDDIPNHVSETKFRFTGGKDESKSSDKLPLKAVPHSDLKVQASEGPLKHVGVDKNRSRTLALLSERRKKENHAFSERSCSEHVGNEHLFTKEDLDRVSVHPEDQRYYDNFRLWRYDIVPRQGNDDEDADAKKPRGEHWTPFHRLSDYDKMLVETKLGPKLAVVLRTRWPGARIDRMEPLKPLPLV